MSWQDQVCVPRREVPEASPACLSGPGRGQRARLGILVLAWGAQAIVTQSLLLREAMVLMFGSELAWGVVLFAWLLGVAVGAAAGGGLSRIAAARGQVAAALVAALLGLSVVSAVELWAFRGARAWLGVGPGEFLAPTTTALAAILLVWPAGILVGLAFPLACNVTVAGRTLLSFGQVYALESAGSLIGGAAFSFWAVEHLTPIQTLLVCGAVTAAAAAGLVSSEAGGRPLGLVKPLSLGVMAGGVLLLALLAGDALNRRLVQRRWQNIAPGYELVAEAESRYQNLAVGARAGQYTLYCDGHVSADFPDPYTFVPLAHFWMCQHPAPRRVLVLGGGAEGLLAEILHHPVEHIDYVETDPQQIDIIRPLLAEADRAALADRRVAVHPVDPRYFVKTQRGCFDLVIARLPEPTSALRTRFYTREFFAELRRAMATEAVLCLTAAAAPAELSAASREYLAGLRATLAQHFPYLTVGWCDPAHILAATSPGLTSTDPDELAERYRQRGVQAARGSGFDPIWFAGATDWLAPDKLRRRSADLDAATAPQVSSDLRPVIYVQRLALWEAATGRTRMMAWLCSVGLPQLALLLGIGGVITLLVCRWRRGPVGWSSGAVSLSVATTGLVTMALSILWLFAFQNLYGYVYQRIGWIVALFMAGLVMGCALGGRLALGQRRRSNSQSGAAPRPAGDRSLWPLYSLVSVDMLLAGLSFVVPVVLHGLALLPSEVGRFPLVEVTVSAMVVLTGLLGGAAFALAGHLQLGAIGRPGAAAASVVGADHAGACLGALLSGLLLVPVFGTVTAACLLGGMKLCSGVLLVAAGRARAGARAG